MMPAIIAGCGPRRESARRIRLRYGKRCPARLPYLAASGLAGAALGCALARLAGG